MPLVDPSWVGIGPAVFDDNLAWNPAQPVTSAALPAGVANGDRLFLWVPAYYTLEQGNAGYISFPSTSADQSILQLNGNALLNSQMPIALDIRVRARKASWSSGGGTSVCFEHSVVGATASSRWGLYCQGGVWQFRSGYTATADKITSETCANLGLTNGAFGWVRVVVKSSAVEWYRSTDGQTWTLTKTDTGISIPYPPPPYSGNPNGVAGGIGTTTVRVGGNTYSSGIGFNGDISVLDVYDPSSMAVYYSLGVQRATIQSGSGGNPAGSTGWTALNGCVWGHLQTVFVNQGTRFPLGAGSPPLYGALSFDVPGWTFVDRGAFSGGFGVGSSNRTDLWCYTRVHNGSGFPFNITDVMNTPDLVQRYYKKAVITAYRPSSTVRATGRGSSFNNSLDLPYYRDQWFVNPAGGGSGTAVAGAWADAGITQFGYPTAGAGVNGFTSRNGSTTPDYASPGVPQVVSVTEHFDPSTVNPSSIVIPAPSGIQDGDLMILCVRMNPAAGAPLFASNGGVSPRSGWTDLGSRTITWSGQPFHYLAKYSCVYKASAGQFPLTVARQAPASPAPNAPWVANLIVIRPPAPEVALSSGGAQYPTDTMMFGQSVIPPTSTTAYGNLTYPNSVVFIGSSFMGSSINLAANPRFGATPTSSRWSEVYRSDPDPVTGNRRHGFGTLSVVEARTAGPYPGSNTGALNWPQYPLVGMTSSEYGILAAISVSGGNPQRLAKPWFADLRGVASTNGPLWTKNTGNGAGAVLVSLGQGEGVVAQLLNRLHWISAN